MNGQSRLDAMADAETLRLVALDHFTTPMALGYAYGQRYRDYHCYGCASVALMKWPDGRDFLPSVPDDVFVEMARQDARAALRAVPGLFDCQFHEPTLLDEGTLCRNCGVRLPL